MNKKMILLLLIVLVFVSSCKDESPVKIGISWESNFENGEISEDLQVYIDSVKMIGAKPILLNNVNDEKEAKKALENVEALIMTGGHDISAQLYNEKESDKLEETNLKRDKSDLLILKEAISKDMPVLGTCRGMQIINILQGGNLFQDINTEYETKIAHRDPELFDFIYHDIFIEKDSKLYKMVNKEKLM